VAVVKDEVTIGQVLFNSPGNWAWVCDVMEGWESTAQLELPLVANGGGHGAVLGGPPRAKERYMTLGGAILAENEVAAEDARQLLLEQMPLDGEFQVHRRGRTMFCRLFDAVDTDLQTPRGFRWTASVVALDPFRYAPEPVTGLAGAFSGAAWFRTYDTGNQRTYTSNAFTYLSPEEVTELPSLVVITNDGGATSQRLTLEVAGPLTAGNYRIANETLSQEMWVDLDIPAGKTIVIDPYTTTVTYGGQDVTQLAFGDWPVLGPGANTFRLYTGDLNQTAYLQVEGYSAWR